MARRYTLRKRAQRQAETRRRIVEAAIELHCSIGPAKTTVSALAEKAGVQRHTYYAHFPEETQLMAACSGLYLERNPLPDPARWEALSDPIDRLRRAVTDMYAYYEANCGMLQNVLRDAATHERTREIVQQRMAPAFGRLHAVVLSGFPRRKQGRQELEAAVALALDFATWQMLRRQNGLSRRRAVELAVRIVACAGAPSSGRR